MPDPESPAGAENLPVPEQADKTLKIDRTDETDEEKSSSPSGVVKFRTTFAHQMFLLISSAFFVFELCFLWLYSDRSWFFANLILWSVPTTLLTLALAHGILRWLESPTGCRLSWPIGKGMPLVCYRNWVVVDEPEFPAGIQFGNRRATWRAIDQAELTFFGNLLFKSHATSGGSIKRVVKGKERDLNPPQLIFKLPFGVASRRDQIRLITLLLSRNSSCLLNDRLKKQIAKDEPKGSQVVLNIVSVCFLLFFTDVVYSTFNYVEMLKEYCLAHESADADSINMPDAGKHFEEAEKLRLHPLPISWVTRKMFDTASTKSGVMQIRADALWSMQKHQEAIDSMREALEEHSKNYRAELKLSRMLVEDGRLEEAYPILDKALEKSKKAFVPRMYYLALLHRQRKEHQSTNSMSDAIHAGSNATSVNRESAEMFYENTMKSLDDELFKDFTGWPPGVSPYLPDVWHRDDVEFVVRRMLDMKQSPWTPPKVPPQ
jgi:tetratricopeptide (TPR) repeat protein